MSHPPPTALARAVVVRTRRGRDVALVFWYCASCNVRHAGRVAVGVDRVRRRPSCGLVELHIAHLHKRAAA